MKLFGAADYLTTLGISTTAMDIMLEDVDFDEFESTLTISLTSTLLGCVETKDKKEVQARAAQTYIDSLSTEQLAEFDELLKQKEMEMLSKESYDVSLNNSLVAKVPKLDTPNMSVAEKPKTFKKC